MASPPRSAKTKGRSPTPTKADHSTSTTTNDNSKRKRKDDNSGEDPLSFTTVETFRMFLEKKFERACEEVQLQLFPQMTDENPFNDTFFELWGLYKQVHHGDIDVPIPKEPKEKLLKCQAWKKVQGLSKERAMAKYIDVASATVKIDFTKEEFERAVEDVAISYLPFITEGVPDDGVYELFGLYKQATVGDQPETEQPEDDSEESRRKHDAWKSRRRMSQVEAMRTYTRRAEKLIIEMLKARGHQTGDNGPTNENTTSTASGSAASPKRQKRR